MRGRRRWDRPVRVAAQAGLALGLAVLVPACAVAGPPRAAAPQAASPSAAAGRVLPVHLTAAQVSRLPLATTYGRSPRAPQDPDPLGPETGVVVHPTAMRVVYARPGGPPVAALPARELGSPTWVPVIQSQRGWDRVLLPTRPNRSTGWIYLGNGGLQIASDGYRIKVSLNGYRLTVTDNGRSRGSWPAAIGAPDTPTPAGRTFLLASAAPARPTYSPLIFPLGLHSDSLRTFGGGPGTVALHGWPDPAVFGRAVSHGCIRVPAAALRVLARVPIGSPVMITGTPAETRQPGL